jgi:hypothetical protein
MSNCQGIFIAGLCPIWPTSVSSVSSSSDPSSKTIAYFRPLPTRPLFSFVWPIIYAPSRPFRRRLNNAPTSGFDDLCYRRASSQPDYADEFRLISAAICGAAGPLIANRCSTTR